VARSAHRLEVDLTVVVSRGSVVNLGGGADAAGPPQLAAVAVSPEHSGRSLRPVRRQTSPAVGGTPCHRWDTSPERPALRWRRPCAEVLQRHL